MNSFRALVGVVVFWACLVSGCGGGGDSSESTPQPAVTVSTTADALVFLNQYRAAAGVNPLVMDDKMMKAAENHAKYLSNITLSSDLHSEDPSKTGFTGVSLTNRLAAVGYVSAVASEVIAPDNILLNPTGNPTVPIRSLFNAPYHGLALLRGHHDFGMGLAKSGQTMFTVIDTASKTASEFSTASAGEVRVWPCNGLSNIHNKSVGNEIPKPIPGRNIESDPIGTPTYVFVSVGNKLVLTSYEIRSSAGAVAIAKVLGQDVADLVAMNSNEMAILPDKPLALGTTYTSTITGTNNGQPFSKVCQFTTSS